MSKRKYLTAEQKVAIVRRHLLEDVPVSDRQRLAADVESFACGNGWNWLVPQGHVDSCWMAVSLLTSLNRMTSALSFLSLTTLNNR